MPLSETAKIRRAKWIDEIVTISGRFGQDAARISDELEAEIKRDGSIALVDHLQLCGTIPERYGHDSSEEKLYSKYTDALLAAAYRRLGLKSLVLSERADAADVEAFAADYSLVADAKAFRLSRTAKNQKDFKIEALHGWKRGKPHAMVVCPLYQLHARSSQIYQQAIARNVCIFSYSHLTVLILFAELTSSKKSQELLLKIFRCTEQLNPGKGAVDYWSAVNLTILGFDKKIPALWAAEKLITIEAIAAAKEEGLIALAKEREEIMRMSREQAIARLIQYRNIEGRERVINAVSNNGLMEIG